MMRIAIALALVAGAALAGCDRADAPTSSQVGPNPPLPEQTQYLVPPIKIAPVAKWNGATPTVPAGLKIAALATGLKHPRSLYVLPNGDVLVVETNGPAEPGSRPKDIIMGWVQSFAGAAAKGGNRITLLRDADGDGKP